MISEESLETLRQFVIRAVHIETHSFASDRSQLDEIAQSAWRVTFSLDQTVAVERDLPDEERMESLASRVRPLTLATEPIHHAKVMAAIDTVVDSCDDSPRQAYRIRVAQLRDDWLRNGLDQDSWLRYQVSITDPATSDPPVEATDVQLAAGWFYADVAHANPTGWKRDALQFSRATRYEAAVPRWSMLAVTALRTLDLMRELHADGVLDLSADVFAPDLATARETPEETVVMAAPRGSPMPGPAGTAPGPEWVRVNVGEAARLDPRNRVDVVLSRDGQELLRRPGAVIAHDFSDETLRIDVLVDEAVVFHIVGRSADVGQTIQSELDKVWQTNRSLSDGWRLLDHLRGSDSLAFIWEGGEPRIAYTMQPTTAPSESVPADYIDDIATIEAILGTRLPLVDQIPNANGRAAAHLLRLAMQGELVAGPNQPIDVTTPNGSPPQVIQVSTAPIAVADATIPARTLHVWHSNATITQFDDGNTYRISTPDGEPFLIWDPAARSMDLAAASMPTAWIATSA